MKAPGANRERQPVGDDVRRLEAILRSHEGWLMRRILEYAKKHGYTAFTSTLEEAWRMSIVGLSTSLVEAVTAGGWEMELGAQEDLASDPAGAFGVQEAIRHKRRGVPLGMFLGLTKYYRQTYLDLASELDCGEPDAARLSRAVVRFFDRLEIGFCEEWVRPGEASDITELQAANRAIINEKNRYLTIFESIKVPVLLLSPDATIENVNQAAAQVFALGSVSGEAYYSRTSVGDSFPPLEGELAVFMAGSEPEASFESPLSTAGGARHFQVSMKRMLDVSGKFAGTTVVLNDITERKEAEDVLRSLTLRDDLTGLSNRRGFEALGRQLVSVARRQGKTLGLLFVDFDGLKAVNDRFGHQLGDAALVEAGVMLTESFRASDVIARVGGDEFAVLCMAANEPTVHRLVGRLREGLRARRPTGEAPFELRLSIGIATHACEPLVELDLGELLERADARMYEEKQSRRSQPSPGA